MTERDEPVRENPGRDNVIGPLPTLFAGIGPCAEKTLVEFSHQAQGLPAPVQGPFGLVLADGRCEELFTCDWSWASEIRAPESASARERFKFIGPEEGKLLACLSSVVRRLRVVEPGVDPAGGSRSRLNAYVLIDLSEPVVVTPAVRLLRVLRQIDTAFDTTVLSLTGRTAATNSTSEGRWFETWKELLEQLQEEPFAQRVYLLDGCDTDKTWFERPEQLHRLGAEFLVYHGLMCRSLLRPKERARTGSQESILNVCGSFGCRTIPADLSVVARRVAERLAREDLADLHQRQMPSGWSHSVEEMARLLAERMAQVCEKVQRQGSAGGYRGRSSSRPTWDVFRDEPRHRGPMHEPPGDAEISEAIVKTIRQVCSREPLVSLRHFFLHLQPRLARLLTQQRLRDRARIHQMVAETFRQQYENTYEPIRVWLSVPQTRWVDRFTPAPGEACHVMVSRPAGMRSYFVGWLVLALGLAGVAIGAWSNGRLLLVAGGLLSIAASVLMALPAGWTRCPRSRIREGQEIRASVPPVSYRMRPGWRIRLAASAMVLVGLAGVTWPLWPEAWTWTTAAWAAVLVAAGGVGLAFVVHGPKDVHPDQVGGEEAPDHLNPPVWRSRMIGMFCLATAWMILCLVSPSPVAAETVVPWLAHLGGLGLVATGLGLALFPRVGQTYLVDRMAKMPQPLAGGIGHPIKENELLHGIATMAAWVDHLVLNFDQPSGPSGATDLPQAGETLLDYLTPDWDTQLAQAFRRTLEARSSKPLPALALQPVLWTECIVRELQDLRITCRDLTSLFVMQLVKAWIESQTFGELLSFLTVDAARFGRLVGRLVAPHWPAPRVEPDLSVNIVAAGPPLWDLLAPAAGPGIGDRATVAPLVTSDRRRPAIRGSPPQPPDDSLSGLSLARLDWDARGDRILILRLVQGLREGWRGFPGLPGQLGVRRGRTPEEAPSLAGRG